MGGRGRAGVVPALLLECAVFKYYPRGHAQWLEGLLKTRGAAGLPGRGSLSEGPDMPWGRAGLWPRHCRCVPKALSRMTTIPTLVKTLLLARWAAKNLKSALSVSDAVMSA